LTIRPASVFSRTFSALAALALALIAGAQLAGQPASAPLTLLSRDGRRSLPVTVAGDQEFVALDDLASALQLAVREESGALTVSYRGRTIVLTPEQPLASVAGRLVSLPAAATRAGGRWIVPLEFISRAVAPIYDVRLDLRRPSRLLVIGDMRVPRVAIRVETQPNAARLNIDTTPSAGNTVAQEAGRLVIRFDADALDLAPGSTTTTAQGPANLVQAIRQLDAVSIAVDLGPRFASYRASTSAAVPGQPAGATTRVTIDLLAASTETTTAPPAPTTPPPSTPPGTPGAPGAPPPAELPVFGQRVSSLRTVMIDPGHGGDDLGARSEDGSHEKDITLAVARRLKSTIEGRLGLRVLLTRDDDRYVSLDQRAALANNNKADVLISLHANASVRPATRGASIFVAAFDENEQARAGLTPERVPVFGGGSRDIELVLWELAQIRYIGQSGELAKLLEEALRSRIPIDARGIGRAPLRILESANMPAVLIEMGYLTNRDQARRLAGGDYQNLVVGAILDSLILFRDYLSAPGGEQ
jgi:N-acetylmuramoyl-L-alanine amidase